jgi:pimeloyl-ACP methyl ester carboxylesterase
MLARSSAGLAVAAVLVAGCAGGGGHATATRSNAATTTRPAAAFDGCLRPGPAVQIVAVPAPGVSLSGERILGAQRDLLVDARRLRVPTLWVSSENDSYTKFASETRQLYRGARGHAQPNRLLVVGGDDHGIDLLTGAQARRVVPAVTRFIRRG